MLPLKLMMSKVITCLLLYDLASENQKNIVVVTRLFNYGISNTFCMGHNHEHCIAHKQRLFKLQITSNLYWEIPCIYTHTLLKVNLP